MNNKLGSILTFVRNPAEMEVAVQWLNSSDNVWAWTTLPTTPPVKGAPAPYYGLEVLRPPGEAPTLRSVLGNLLQRMRGKEMIGFGMPYLVLPTDFSPLNNMFLANRMEITFAFHYRVDPKAPYPDFFILTTSILPYILHDLKEDVLYQGDTWQRWLDNWCHRTMLPHKYLDAAQYIAIVPQPVTVTPDESF